MCDKVLKYCYRKDLKEKMIDRKIKFTINDSEEFTFDEMNYLNNQFQFYKEMQNEEYTKEQVISKKKKNLH